MKQMYLLAAVWLAALLGGAMIVLPSSAHATPKFTQETGKPCNFCHSRPPALNANGKKFKDKGNRL